MKLLPNERSRLSHIRSLLWDTNSNDLIKCHAAQSHVLGCNIAAREKPRGKIGLALVYEKRSWGSAHWFTDVWEA